MERDAGGLRERSGNLSRSGQIALARRESLSISQVSEGRLGETLKHVVALALPAQRLAWQPCAREPLADVRGPRAKRREGCVYQPLHLLAQARVPALIGQQQPKQLIFQMPTVAWQSHQRVPDALWRGARLG